MAGVLLTQVRIYGKHTSVLGREIGEELRKDFPTGDGLGRFSDVVVVCTAATDSDTAHRRTRQTPAWASQGQQFAGTAGRPSRTAAPPHRAR